MAKISDLPRLNAAASQLLIPANHNGETVAAPLELIAQSVQPLLADYYKGDPGADASQVGTFLQAQLLSYAPEINRIHTIGFLAEADGGAAFYDRWLDTMEPLPIEGQGIWWFEAADESRWQMAAADQHTAPQFGAMGGPGIDVAPIFNAALAAPMVRGLQIGALTHYFTPEIVVPSGKSLRGVSRALSWMKVIPLTSGEAQQKARFAIVHRDDMGGVSEDYSLDCQRSGLGRGDDNRTHGLCVIATKDGRCEGTRVRRVDVHNSWGYAQYTVATIGGTARVRDVVHEDCRAYNFQVGFETTGHVTASSSRDTTAHGDPIDGGPKIPMEALYHEYGAIQSFTRFNAYGRGTGGAGILIFTTDGVDIEDITYREPDVLIDTLGGTALVVEGRGGNRVNRFLIAGGSVTGSDMGGVFRNGRMLVRNAAIVGLDGNGLELGAGVDIDFHDPTIEGNRAGAGDTAAVGIVDNGVGPRRWYGSGRVSADGPPGSYALNKAAFAFFGTPQLAPFGEPVPPAAGSIVRERMFRIPRADWIVSGTQDLQVRIDLVAAQEDRVADIQKAHLIPTLEFPFPNGGVNNPAVSFAVLWIDQTQVRIYVKCDQPLTGWVLKARLTEYA